MPQNDSHTVWSSESGDLRKKKQDKPAATSLPAGRQTAYLHRDSKGRAGKGVLLIKNLTLSEADMNALVKKIKQACGTGGTVKGGMIEIQGQDREKVAAVLVSLGYKVKLAGG